MALGLVGLYNKRPLLNNLRTHPSCVSCVGQFMDSLADSAVFKCASPRISISLPIVLLAANRAFLLRIVIFSRSLWSWPPWVICASAFYHNKGNAAHSEVSEVFFHEALQVEETTVKEMDNWKATPRDDNDLSILRYFLAVIPSLKVSWHVYTIKHMFTLPYYRISAFVFLDFTK